MKNMEWFVRCFDKKQKKFVDLNVVPYFGTEKDWILEPSSKEEFSERLWTTVRYYFLEEYRYWLDTYDREDGYEIFPPEGDYAFQEKHSIRIKKNNYWEKVWAEAKEIEGLPGIKHITICDQLKAQWDDFVDYCWMHKEDFQHLDMHPYGLL